MVTKKDRRRNGYVSPRATISPKDLINYDLFINDFYDDWEDYRDGFRDWYNDFKLIKIVKSTEFSPQLVKRLKMNKKQKILLRRRKQRKNKTKRFD